MTRDGRRIYLGSDLEYAIQRYHEMGLGLGDQPSRPTPSLTITVKELANHFLATQQANSRNPKATLKSYKDWLGRFLSDHPRLRAVDFTVEAFASWKLSLRNRGYSAESINHYLTAVRGMFRFAEDKTADLLGCDLQSHGNIVRGKERGRFWTSTRNEITHFILVTI